MASLTNLGCLDNICNARRQMSCDVKLVLFARILCLDIAYDHVQVASLDKH
jgi:hypothetical protein